MPQKYTARKQHCRISSSSKEDRPFLRIERLHLRSFTVSNKMEYLSVRVIRYAFFATLSIKSPGYSSTRKTTIPALFHAASLLHNLSKNFGCGLQAMELGQPRHGLRFMVCLGVSCSCRREQIAVFLVG